MRLSLPEYWRGHEDAIRKRSVDVEPAIGNTEAWVLSDPADPYFGCVDVLVWFDEDCFLAAFEFVEINEDGRPERKKYSYHLSVDGKEVERHDYDERIEDPALRHHVNRVIRGKNIHIPSERISLVKMVERSWALIAEERGEIQEITD